MKFDLSTGYTEALKFANSHYENFPTASLLIPKDLRKHVAVIYQFARTADDYADEHNYDSKKRLELLNDFENQFYEALNGKWTNNMFYALANTINEKQLTIENFTNLVFAFKQDTFKDRYKNYNELIEYCRYSANPVGRLILELFQIKEQEAFLLSDKICTALQLTNFWQDVSVDYKKGRIYLPQNEISDFNVNQIDFENNSANSNFKQLISFQVARTQKLFDEGKNLLNFLNGRLKLQIKLTIIGGEEILIKIKQQDFDVLQKRPKIERKDFFKLLKKVILS